LTEKTIEEILNEETKTIGEIATLKSINPGTGYDTNVFTRVIERDVYPYRIYDNIINITNTVGVFSVGEIVESGSGAKGRVENVKSGQIKIKRLSFDIPFIGGDVITGQTTSATADVSSVIDTINESPMGFNANISSVVMLRLASIIGSPPS